MASKKRDFYGKEVTDAIKKACDKLEVPQEQLEIEVVETGSTGIFGLIRKKAHIRAYVKQAEAAGSEGDHKAKKKDTPKKSEETVNTSKEQEKQSTDESTQLVPQEDLTEPKPLPLEEKAAPPKPKAEEQQPAHHEKSQAETEEKPAEEQVEELSEEIVILVREELDAILNLMGYPSEIEISNNGSAVTCRISEKYEKQLTGEDGKTLDSLQYLLRKIVARKVPSRLRLTVDVGNYRERRLSELKERAADLSAKVKEDGKTQVIAALSPSERRVIHMSLQDDKEIRSRSVGEGLFKKILIYKPGKSGKGGGRKRNNSRGRRGSNKSRKNS